MLKSLLFIALLTLPLSACLEKEASHDISSLTVITEEEERHFDVELALTPDQHAQGLMHRSEMDDDAGMLFYFGGSEAERGFWMKNTLIPLDIIFIKADGTIHHIHEYAIPGDLTSIRSKGPVAAVLEINGGESVKSGIKAGNKVIHQVFKQNQAQ